MKRILSIVAVVWAAAQLSYAQKIEAKVVDETNNEPIAYVAVGVVERTCGTLTDSLGCISLTIPSELDADTLRISCVGYASVSMSVAEARQCSVFALAPRVEELSEVEVMPIKTKIRNLGRRANRGPMCIKVEGESSAGKELGMQFKVKKRAWIKSISFAIEESYSMLAKMPFRLNLYDKNGVENTNNLVSSTLFQYNKEAMKDGRFTFALPTPFAIEGGEYIIAIEFLEKFPNKKFLMRTNVMTGQTFYRYAPQTSWKKIPLGSTLAVELIEEK